MNSEIGEVLVEEVCPRIRSLSPSFNVIGPEDREELCQEAIAIAAKLMVNNQKRGKRVTPGNVAYYAAGLVRQGRRSTGSERRIRCMRRPRSSVASRLFHSMLA